MSRCFFFKQKTAYEMRMSDWSSDVCSSDLPNRRDQYIAATDSAVGFLIDCSGSMRSCVEPIAVMVDILMRALGQIGVATEILGFTTSAWNGGRARQDWLKSGAPVSPGRLNEVRHLVFQTADATWRRASRPWAALFKADLFRVG